MLKIGGYSELHVLVNALLTFKFDSNFADPDVRMYAGSPILSAVLYKAYEALIAVARANLNEFDARKREDRQIITENDDFVARAVLAHLSYAFASWRTWDSNEKRGFIETLASPFLLSDEVIEFLVNNTNEQAHVAD